MTHYQLLLSDGQLQFKIENVRLIMMKYCFISSFILLHFCDANVPRPVKIAAIFDDNSDMRHDLMFVNAIKARVATNHRKCLIIMMRSYI